MSTRCQIVVEGSNVVIYRHSDGYPDGKYGVLEPLSKTVANFVKHRGFDTFYLPAHILHDQIFAHIKWAEDWIAQRKLQNEEYSMYETSKYLGYGVESYDSESENAFHSDIEFLYVIKKDGMIEVRKFKDNAGTYNLRNTELVKSVKVF